MWRPLLVFFFIVGWSSWACEENPPVKTVAAAECACDPKVQDKYEEPVRFGFGYYKGQCIDTCRFRKSHLLENGARHQVVTNFQHQGKFWLAEIPLDGVEKIDVAFEEFAPKINHVYLRFRFKQGQPVILRSQTDPSVPSVKLHDFIVSPEGSPARDSNYTMKNGLLNDYLITYRLVSAADVYQWSYVKLKHPTRQHRLKIDDARELRRILEASLDASRTRSLNEVYNLISNNCATSTIDLVYGKTSTPRTLEAAMPLDLFFGTYSELKRKGKIKGVSDAGLPNLEQEMNL